MQRLSFCSTRQFFIYLFAYQHKLRHWDIRRDQLWPRNQETSDSGRSWGCKYSEKWKSTQSLILNPLIRWMSVCSLSLCPWDLKHVHTLCTSRCISNAFALNTDSFWKSRFFICGVSVSVGSQGGSGASAPPWPSHGAAPALILVSLLWLNLGASDDWIQFV